MLTVPGPGGSRRRLRVPFVAATLFFTVFPFLSLLANPPQPAALALLVVGWAIFVAVIVALFRGGPFSRPFGGSFLRVGHRRDDRDRRHRPGRLRDQPRARRSTSTPA